MEGDDDHFGSIGSEMVVTPLVLLLAGLGAMLGAGLKTLQLFVQAQLQQFPRRGLGLDPF